MPPTHSPKYATEQMSFILVQHYSVVRWSWYHYAFLAVTFKSSILHFQLFTAESHKINPARPTPNIYKTIIILWALYRAFPGCLPL
jgi:hypothetical protein